MINETQKRFFLQNETKSSNCNYGSEVRNEWADTSEAVILWNSPRILILAEVRETTFNAPGIIVQDESCQL